MNTDKPVLQQDLGPGHELSGIRREENVQLRG